MVAFMKGRYADWLKAILVFDNFNEHTIGVFYKTVESSRGLALVSRIKFRLTPKHCSWPNIAEIESSCLTRRCISSSCICNEEELRAEAAAWSNCINSCQSVVDSLMGIAEIRTKLQSIWPGILL
jgi:hypothetical protein